MPIEIDELRIRMTVDGDSATGGPGTGGGRSGLSQTERNELLADCVEQVLRILRDREER
ncbi:DUF5908 family protein [Brachybacterium vulturis]|uniref:DUF5908 family protein n=1 Tax=Brachybacterium vulturis TaxID=2017484 RepID=UPI003736E22D